MTDDHRARANAPPPPLPLTPDEIRAWLDYALDALIARRDEILAALTADVDDCPTIDDDTVLGEIGENVAMARTLASTAEDRRREHKKPFLDGGKAVDAWFRTLHAPLDAPLETLQARMTDYGRRKLAQSKAAAEAAFHRAKQQAELAASLAAAAMAEQPEMVEQRLADAAATAAVMDQAQERLSARPAEHTRTYGTYGAVMSLRQTWRWRVTDPERVPRAYLRIDPELIKAAVKGGKRGPDGQPLVKIPGIEFIPETAMGVR